MRYTLLVGLLALGCAPSPSAPRSDKPVVEFYPVPGRTDLPFSKAVRVGHLLYLSGELGTDSTGKLVPGGIQAETKQALENIRATLASHGSDLDHVVKCTAMLADMAEWGAMNQVYVTFFKKNLPARSAFGATGLALGARMELECIAVIP